MGDESGSNPPPGKERPSTSPSPNTPSDSVRPPFSLLLAEDNLPDTLLVREAIKMENLPLEVIIAPDGERAIDLIVTAENDPQAPCPHVLLLDINLPRIDGFDVLRRIRASDKFKNLPVLMVTSSDSPADRSEAARLGARYFRKPVTYDEFLKIGAILRELLEDSGLL
ncbi:MAG: response regulator [Bryobacteraceae bacterium]